MHIKLNHPHIYQGKQLILLLQKDYSFPNILTLSLISLTYYVRLCVQCAYTRYLHQQFTIKTYRYLQNE